MNKLIQPVTKFGYKRVVKPILFKFHPDGVHSRLLVAAGITQKSGLLLGLLRHSWSYKNKDVLSQKVMGLDFMNPVGLSAGFDKNIETAKIMKAIGFGFMTGGSVTHQPCAGNDHPWFYRLPKSRSIVVYVGLANQGIVAIRKRILRYKKSDFDDFPLVISVAKTNSKEASNTNSAISDYIGSLEEIKKYDLSQIVEINISCPNTYGGEPFNTPDRLEKLLTAVDKVDIGVPVLIKMPQDLEWVDFRALLDVIVVHNISGVTLTNLAKDRTKLDLADDLPDSVKGNLSGKPTEARCNYLIEQTYLNYSGKLVIVGVGGVFSAEDAYRKIRLGANLVGLITGIIFNGPQLVGDINKGLVALLKKDGYDNVNQAIGVDAGKVLQP